MQISRKPLAIILALLLISSARGEALWQAQLPPGVIEIREPVIYVAKMVQGSGRQTVLKSFVAAGETTITIIGITPKTGGGVKDLTIELVNPGASGIKLIECCEAEIRNVLIKPAKNARTGGIGICIDGKAKGSAFNRFDLVTVMLCEKGFLLDTSEYPIAWCNRNTFTAIRIYGCDLGMHLRSAGTNWFQGSFEKCGRGVGCSPKSPRNTFHVVEEANADVSLIGFLPQGNEMTGSDMGPRRIPYYEG